MRLTIKFNGHGYLEAGLHEFGELDFEAFFVTSFPHSSTRKQILEGYRKHLAEILSLVGTCEQYLDGSYVTNKNDPSDLDLVVLLDATVVDSLPPAKQLQLQSLLAGPVTKAQYMCDAYFCPVYPEGHPMHSASRQQRKYWLGEFGYDRNDLPKGIVHVKLSASAATP